ncbi:MAG: MBL fold metallo-hydrolase [Candidatus Thorarchaeota archaeon]|jgi:L-ascorbate metabolism protein UlaG (beta-lactamase superfamily)
MGVTIRWLGHASFQIKAEGKITYIDLYRSKKQIERVPGELEPASIVLVTHAHNDHCFPDAINIVRTKDTKVVAPEKEAVHAYNVKRFRSPGNPYHPKGYGVGYVLTVENKTIYFAGDTDVIPEMEELGQVDVALLPCGDTYTMDNADAGEAIKIINPKTVIPMHTWDKSVDEFKKIVESETDTKFVFLKEGEELTI